MGAWSLEPWGNDAAADWMRSFFRSHAFDADVEAALNSDKPDLIRAAAFILERIGAIYVWPGDLDALARNRELAISKLEELVADDDEEYEPIGDWERDSGIVEEIERQKSELLRAFKSKS